MAQNTVRVSKELSYLLRHGAERAGLKMDRAGFVLVDDILATKGLRGVSAATVREIVAGCPKQRFALKTDSATGKLLIRANQGHTLAGTVAAEELLTPITDASAYPIVVHGTYAEAWVLIKASGISKMARMHIHFAVGLPGDSGVISGMRGSATILIYIDMAKALADGVPFFVSSNNVVLCPGAGATGTLPMKYVTRVINRSTGVVLFGSEEAEAEAR